MENTQEEQIISSLFEQAKAVYKKDDTPHPFNIFSVLRLEHKEVILHSRFIAELLNPNGKHGKGKRFLELFFEIIGFDSAKAKKIVSVTNETQNIDILLEAQDWAIIIENKIYSGDSEKQILTYYEKIKQNKREVYVLYLHPFGKKPEGISYKNDKNTLKLAENRPEKDKIFCISYKKHIRAWIEKCREEVPQELELYIIFSQYRNVLKRITGQVMSHMSHQFIEKMTDYFEANPQSFKYALAIPEAVDVIKTRTKQAFWNELKQELEKNNLPNNKTIDLYSEIGFYWKMDSKKKNPIFFWVLMDGDGDDGCCIGFGLEYSETNEYTYPSDKALQSNPAMNCKDLVLFQLDESSRCKWGWLAKYTMIEKDQIDFNTFASERSIDMLDATKRKAFIATLVKDIKTLIDDYVS